MYALTEIAPWGFAIMHLGKTVENRSWYPHDGVIGHRIAIHQGKTLEEHTLRTLRRQHGGRPTFGELVLGAVIGTVLLKGFVYVRRDGAYKANGLTNEEAEQAMASPWRNPEARCLWVLIEPKPLATPIRCRGNRLLWQLPADVLEALVSSHAIQGGLHP